jgi:N-methylhydantoinase A
VLFADGGWQEVPIYQRRDLAVGTTLDGPTIIEQRGSTLVVPVGWTVVVDDLANSVAERVS